MPQLSAAQYGKDNIRVYKVQKDKTTGKQDVTEMTVCVLLSGDIETSYTKADNSVVVATDTMKQTTYITAKQNPVNPPELFGAILANHFVTKYSHIHTAQVKVKQHRWTRVVVKDQPHPHSFFRDSAETRNAEVVATKDKGISIRSAVAGLLVLKSTGSAFHSFIHDEFTALHDVEDRILSTEVDSGWTWNTFETVQEVESSVEKFDKAWKSARQITLDLFATENSPSVQNTMYKMCEEILAVVPEVNAVDYSLPNKHYFEIGEAPSTLSALIMLI
ncbi:uncharacterized protein KY384_005483 [Bacidia gigantensis]|uniref:uncharacterized protein n=1 Tax=Bacidia gigantensis TaxID=2732470 RepID=UPI001D046EDE|nr:uncharacterized protein KY384_005483 [Bacidia gigantensis]KAG8530001.1 hypothetical protein KY384_005483 [Bacidia gigantensis]